jgi:protein HIRA/HIR1
MKKLTRQTGKYRELQRLTLQYARVLDFSLEDGSVDVEQMDVET